MPNAGEIVRLRTLRNYAVPPPDGTQRLAMISEDWSAPDGKVYVCLILGVEPKDGSDPLNAVKMLEHLGWKTDDESLKTEWEEHVVETKRRSDQYLANAPARRRARARR